MGGEEKREARRRLAAHLVGVAVYSLVAAGFYALSLIVPGFVTGVPIPGLPEPVRDLGWLVWASLLLISLAFALTAAYNLVEALDPFFEVITKRVHGDVGPAKRVARDLALMLLVVLLAAAATPLVASLGPAAAPARAVMGIAALIVLVILLYDMASTAYRYIKHKVEELMERVLPPA